ncbi:gp004 [Rhodococcus phage ReqiPoco6]|uniref:Gp004 n=1 Tax=Rhodococcus phage ReqiPoco6 TaxID=691964 RepID=D4P7M2_9CAUD|nr:gp004 [Rhodococcus phage ReqiPoco6]ADD81002.1 gp004 [Rhodococcus phage ReqiPoco6]
MTALKLTVPLSFTDSSLPILKSDPMLNAGSLALIEPMHPISQWGAGVPASGATIPNLATKFAVPLLGSNIDGTFINGGFTDATSGKIERTAKGGIHGIVSQAKDAGPHTSTSAGVTLPTSLWDYVASNPTHDFYASFWAQTTRGAVSGKFPVMAIISEGSTTANYLFVMQNSTRPSATNDAPSFIGARGGMVDTGPIVRNVAVSQVTGAMSTGAATKAREFGWGRYRNNASGHFSWVFYRFYMEDLTVSGRTYAQADAADLALKNAAFGAGGRYANDTFTDPTTIP